MSVSGARLKNIQAFAGTKMKSLLISRPSNHENAPCAESMSWGMGPENGGFTHPVELLKSKKRSKFGVRRHWGGAIPTCRERPNAAAFVKV
jgi:hypothetical protein